SDLLRSPARGCKAAAEQGVQATVLTQQMQVLAPQAYEDALQFDQALATASVFHEQEQWQVVIPSLTLRNQDAQAQVQGRWQQTSEPWGWLALQADIAQANAARIGHYLPKAVPVAVRQWLGEALSAGEIHDASIDVEGPLDDFPFDRPLARGTFQVRAPYQQLTLDYHPQPMEGSTHGWPKLTQLHGEFAMDNGDIHVQADHGVFALVQNKAIQVRDVQATLADVRQDVTVKVQGQTEGLAASYQQFYQ